MTNPSLLPPTPKLWTERLLLRPVELADANAIQSLFAEWEIVRHMQAGIPWPYPANGARAHLERELDQVAKGKKSIWALELLSDPGCLIGSINLRVAPPGEDNRGFWLGIPWHRQGLMTEAAHAVTGYAFTDLGWSSLTISNATANVASSRIKQRQGAVLISRSPGDWVEGPGEKETWRIEPEAWTQLYP